jgi:FkbM family methyltransferase
MKFHALPGRRPLWKKVLARLTLRYLQGVTRRSGAYLCDFDGVKVMLDFGIRQHRAMHQEAAYEMETTVLLHRLLRPGDVLVDIGANMGWYSLTTLVKCPQVRMAYAYEPSRQMHDLLCRGIAANRLQERCQAKRLALSDKPGTLTLKNFSALDPMHSSLYALADLPYVEEQIEVNTLDAEAASFVGPPAVIKCDVEGSERDVLRGAREVLRGKFGAPPIWFLEANYETSGMAGYFPWQLIETAAECAPYQGYFIRQGRILPLPGRTALRHSEMLILAIPDVHGAQLEQTALR